MFDILQSISEAGERALVFVEHRRMQYRLIELARARFGLSRIDLINGETPITQRQAIVNGFSGDLRESRLSISSCSAESGRHGADADRATHVIHLSRWWNPRSKSNATTVFIGSARPARSPSTCRWRFTRGIGRIPSTACSMV